MVSRILAMKKPLHNLAVTGLNQFNESEVIITNESK